MIANRYFVRCDERDENGEFLYWSNQHGWVNLSEADIFSGEEMLEFSLPMGGRWEKIKN